MERCGGAPGWDRVAASALERVPIYPLPLPSQGNPVCSGAGSRVQLSTPLCKLGWGRGSRLRQQLTCALFILEWVGLSCLLHAGTPKLRLKLKRGSGASPALEMFVTAASRILPVTPKLAAALPTVVHRAEQSRWGS